MTASLRRRVVITGIGATTPLGLNAQETWRNALNGHSGIDGITLFDPAGCTARIAGEVKNFDVTRPISPIYPKAITGDPGPALNQAANTKEERKIGRFIQLALSAGIEAYADSGLDAIRTQLDPLRLGVNIGVGMGGLPEIERVYDSLKEKGYGRITPFFIPQVIPNLASGHLGILLNFKAANLCNVTACSSSAHSIGESLWLIDRGEADVMLVGGAECVVCPLGVGGFAAMRALSTRNEEPTRASRPFDVDRDGFVMGEGAACLIIEEYEHAKKRGAKIYAEVVGYGATGDAFHITLPAPEGEGGHRAMANALKMARLNPEQIGYINAHGTSTPAGDVEEARAVKSLFPNAKEHLHISSTKSMTGHLLGAAGALEAVFTALAVHEGKIPPTINLDKLDPKCEELGLDFTPHRAVEKKLKYGLSNSFGFGGTNACLILGKV